MSKDKMERIVEELLEEVEKLRKDAARLDHLELLVLDSYYGVGLKFVDSVPEPGEPDMSHFTLTTKCNYLAGFKTLRAAIDGSMELVK